MLNNYRCLFDADFDKLGRIFVLRKFYKVSFHFIKNLLVSLIVKSLKNFRYHKVSELILNVS
jgi:hypothetical protein